MKEKIYTIKLFFRIWFGLPLYFVFFLLIFAGLQSSLNFVIPPVIFIFLIFGSIYFSMTNKRITFYKDYVEIRNGFRYLKIENSKLIRANTQYINRSGDHIFVFFLNKRNKKRKTLFPVMVIGKQNSIEIMYLINKRASHQNKEGIGEENV